MTRPVPTPRAAHAPELELCIESLGGLGDGIASHEGLPVFIPKVLAGEKVRVRITGQTRENARGEIVEIITPSADRGKAACIHYDSCGGCSLQHLSETSYTEFKLRRARDAVRMAGFDIELLQPLVSIPPSSRRRAEFKVLNTPSGVSLAYLGLRSHDRVAISDCKILSPGLHKMSAAFRALFDSLNQKEALESLQLTEVSNGIDVVIGIHAPLHVKVKEILLASIPQPCIRLSLQHGKSVKTVWEKEAPVLQLAKASVAITPGAFLQASLEAQNAITAQVVEALSGAKRVADLFAGLGVYGFSLRKGMFTTAYELDKRMVEAIQHTAAKHKLSDEIKAKQRDLFVSPVTAQELGEFDAAVINPPRTGAKAQCEQIAKSKLKRVVMVSCNPATFSRDAKILREGGFTMKNAVPIDQFTWTAHLEIVAIFEKL